MTRIFLAIVGVAYLVLAVWCSLKPRQTSEAVGLTPTPGSGESEYLVVYGGLELGLALAFLWPMWKPTDAPTLLLVCLLIHACLVVFRAASFAMYQGIGTTTFYLAGVEWAIALGSVACYLFDRTATQN